jgi:hypothetical protein
MAEWTVDDHLRDKPHASVALYHAFVRLVEACGPVTCSVAKTTITFKGSRRGFAGRGPPGAARVPTWSAAVDVEIMSWTIPRSIRSVLSLPVAGSGDAITGKPT